MATTKIDTVTLVADVVTTVTLTQSWQFVEVVIQSGAAAVYFTTNGDAPTKEGDDVYPVAAAVGASRKVRVAQGSDTTTVVKLISGGTPVVSVIGS
jgi:hypothetical protein